MLTSTHDECRIKTSVRSSSEGSSSFSCSWRRSCSPSPSSCWASLSDEASATPAADHVAEATPPERAGDREMPPATKTTPDDSAIRTSCRIRRHEGSGAAAGCRRETVAAAAADRHHVSSRDAAAGRTRAAPHRPGPPSTATEPPTARCRAPDAASGWFVQVAAFKSRENADRQVSQLKAKGYAAVVQADPGSLFRVRIGPFQERARPTARPSGCSARRAFAPRSAGSRQ